MKNISVRTIKGIIELKDFETIKETFIDKEERRNIVLNKNTVQNYYAYSEDITIRKNNKLVEIRKIKETEDTIKYSKNNEKISEKRIITTKYFSKTYYDDKGNLKDTLLDILEI